MDCPHGMPSRPSCIECMEDGPVAPPTRTKPPERESEPFRARYDSRCRCGEPIVGDMDMIVRMSDETYRHAHCAERD